jgi:hypothetical protein
MKPKYEKSTADSLVRILMRHAGERGDNEGAVETLCRIINERNRAELSEAPEPRFRLTIPYGIRRLIKPALATGGIALYAVTIAWRWPWLHHLIFP